MMFVRNTLMRVWRKGAGRPWYDMSAMYVIFVITCLLFKNVANTKISYKFN